MSYRDEVNRANSSFSTGPKTEDGKRRSSQNAIRHGLTAQSPVMPGEDLDSYRVHVVTFHDEYQPEGPTEEQLVESLADIAWRLKRVVSFEAALLSTGAGDAQQSHEVAATFLSQSKALANLSLHTQRLSREFERAIILLRKLQEARFTEEATVLLSRTPGFVFHEPQETPAISPRTRTRPAQKIPKIPIST